MESAGFENVSVRVVSEQEADRGWVFDIVIERRDGGFERTVRLDWTDYDHWSRGRLSPAEVTEGVVRCAASLLGVDRLPDRFDASTLRRLAPEFDDALGAFLTR